MRTEGFVGLLAELTSQAGSVQPFDTSVVSNFKLIDEFTRGDDHASSFMSAHERKLQIEGPVTLHGVQVGVANSGIPDLDQNLVRARLCNGDLLVNKGSTFLLDHLGPLLLRDSHVWQTGQSVEISR